MAEENTKSLLDLDTAEVQRPFIEIDGKRFFLNTTDDLGIKHLAKIGSIGKRVDRIMSKDDLSEAEAVEIADGLSLMVRLIVRDIPGDLEAKLKDGQRLQIVNAFNQAAGLMPATARPKTEEAPEQKHEVSQAV